MKINSVMANNTVNMYNKQKQHTKIEMGSKQLKDKVEISKDAKYLNKDVYKRQWQTYVKT